MTSGLMAVLRICESYGVSSSWLRAAAEDEHKKVPRAAVAITGNEPKKDEEAMKPPVMAVDVTNPVNLILLNLAYCFSLESIIRL